MKWITLKIYDAEMPFGDARDPYSKIEWHPVTILHHDLASAKKLAHQCGIRRVRPKLTEKNDS
jgi:hypothetical protein